LLLCCFVSGRNNVRNINILLLFNKSRWRLFCACVFFTGFLYSAENAHNNQTVKTNLQAVQAGADSIAQKMINAWMLADGDKFYIYSSLENHDKTAAYIFNHILIALSRSGIVLADGECSDTRKIILDIASGGVYYSKIRRPFLWIPGDVTRIVRISALFVLNDHQSPDAGKRMSLNYESVDQFPYSKLAFTEFGDHILGDIPAQKYSGWQSVFETILAGAVLAAIACLFYFIRS
jgi:hypothetical protein